MSQTLCERDMRNGTKRRLPTEHPIYSAIPKGLLTKPAHHKKGRPLIRPARVFKKIYR